MFEEDPKTGGDPRPAMQGALIKLTLILQNTTPTASRTDPDACHAVDTEVTWFMMRQEGQQIVVS